jgi:hypothetical protein
MGAWSAIGGESLVRKGITPVWIRENDAKEKLSRRRGWFPFWGTVKQTEAYRQILQEKISEGIVIPVPDSYVKFYNSTFLVPKKDGVWPKVLNCKELNEHMRVDHFKMEDTKTVTELLLPNDYAISIDLKSAYSHISVHPSLWPYLGFVFERKSYCFLGMPFGLSNAPRIFTKIMRVAMWHIRQKWNIRCVAYLDDLLFLHQSQDELERVARKILP